MPIQPIKDINEYIRVKKSLKERFENERSGDQDSFIDQSKLLQPLIAAQQEATKSLEKAIVEESVNKALVPLTKELQRRNDQIDMLAEQPYFQQEIPAISGPDMIKDTSETFTTPEASKEYERVVLDNDLDQTDIENLQDMSLELPSKVYELSKDPDNNIFEKTFTRIKSINASHGQKTRADNKKQTEKAKEIFKSQNITLKKYKEIIESLQGAKRFVSTPKKKGKGMKNSQDCIIYPYGDINLLVVKLNELYAAKQAGNTGVDNKIITILDELLRINAVSKDQYDGLYKNIFS